MEKRLFLPREIWRCWAVNVMRDFSGKSLTCRVVRGSPHAPQMQVCVRDVELFDQLEFEFQPKLGLDTALAISFLLYSCYSISHCSLGPVETSLLVHEA